LWANRRGPQGPIGPGRSPAELEGRAGIGWTGAEPGSGLPPLPRYCPGNARSTRKEYRGRKRALMASLNGGLPQPTYSEAVLGRAARLPSDLGELWTKATPTERAETVAGRSPRCGSGTTASSPPHRLGTRTGCRSLRRWRAIRLAWPARRARGAQEQQRTPWDTLARRRHGPT